MAKSGVFYHRYKPFVTDDEDKTRKYSKCWICGVIRRVNKSKHRLYQHQDGIWGHRAGTCKPTPPSIQVGDRVYWPLMGWSGTVTDVQSTRPMQPYVGGRIFIQWDGHPADSVSSTYFRMHIRIRK